MTSNITRNIFTLMLLSSIMLPTSLVCISLSYMGSTNNVYAQNNWYMGKGIRPNTYYTYKIQEHDTEQGQPFMMTIYFKQYNNTANYWVAPTTVVFQGQVYNGTLHLSDLDLTPLGTEKLSSNMRHFISAYKDSIGWLSSFVPKPGLPLTAPSWGNIGGSYFISAKGGAAVVPDGSAKVKVPAGTFDATTIRLTYGVNNTIYVNPDMPYPVKGQAFAPTTETNNPTTLFTFDLEATGNGQPPLPKNQFAVSKPPITIQTATGNYFIELVTWQPTTITAGKPIQFGLLFQDSHQNALSSVSYSVKATEGNKIILDIHDQHSSDGTGVQTITFPKAGPVNISISLDAVAGVPTGEFVESATFNLMVV